MKRFLSQVVLLISVLLCTRAALAVDGVVLVNQSTVDAAGGYPYRITQSGSYKLSGNLTAPVNKDVIEIVTSNVTIDLNGFTVTCTASQPGGPFSLYCINDNGSARTNVAIFNGSVVFHASAPAYNFNQIAGISLQYSSSTRIENVLFDGDATNYNGTGLASARYSIVRHNTFHGVASPSISCPSLVEGNVNQTGGSGSSGTGCSSVNNVGSFVF